MNGLVYYMPGESAMNWPRAVDLGLGYVFDTEGPSCVAMNRGPDGKSGVAFGVEGKALTAAGSARWSPIPGSSLWLGIVGTPGPKELARKEQVEGYRVKLSDGNEWLVPVARTVNGSTPLPRNLVWDGKDWDVGEVKEQYKTLFGEACRIWDELTQAETGTLTLSDEADVAVMALGLNYRIGPAEISTLGLFDTRCHAEVLLALVDWPVVKELVKEKAQAGETGGGSLKAETK